MVQLPPFSNSKTFLKAFHKKRGETLLIFAVLHELVAVHLIELKRETSHVQSHCFLHIRYLPR